jgi:thiamine biosynthesis lipoprotein
MLGNGCHTAPRAHEPDLARFEFTSPHMGTMFSITLYAPDHPAAEQAAEDAFRRVAQLEDVMSDYMADSELMRLCAAPVGQPVPVSDDLWRVLERAQELSNVTDGAFDISAGQFTRLWRFSRKRGELPSDTALAAASDTLGSRHLKIDPATRTVTLRAPNMRLDLGGIAKGFAADEALEVLKRAGFPRALVAASGDIRAGDPPPGKPGWSVAVEALKAESLLLSNAAVSTSGDSEQFVEIGGVRYSHIVSPFTGLGLTNRIQCTVMAPDATTSDALATACCVLGMERGPTLLKAQPGVTVWVRTAF